MKRRQFSAAAAAALALPLLPVTGVLAADTGYRTLKQPVPTEVEPGQVEVIEFFSYGCIHCMRFAPILENWKKSAPDNVALRLEHVAFNQAFEPLQKIYYALLAIDQVDKVHDQVFHALQEEHVRLDQPDVLFAWMAAHGVDGDRFEAAYNSFGVATRARHATMLQEAWGVEGTPALGIAGRYYTDGSMARGFDRMLKITDELVERESAKA